MRAALLAILVALAPAHSHSLTFEELAPLPSLPPTPPGVTGWDTLGRASVLFGEANGEETVTTVIPPEVEALDGTEVRLMGFMFPIEAEPELRRFLLVEYPADCPFCLAGMVEPSRMVEVATREPIRWHDEAVIVAGTLEVLRQGDYGLLYRLHEGRLEDENPVP